jgi:hypothetical protein
MTSHVRLALWTLEVQVLVTKLHYLGKQMNIDNGPEPMSSPINNPAYSRYYCNPLWLDSLLVLHLCEIHSTA